MGFLIVLAIVVAAIVYWILQNWLIILLMVVGFLAICVIMAKHDEKKKTTTKAPVYQVTTRLSDSSTHTQPAMQPNRKDEPEYIKKVWTTPNVDILDQTASVPGGDLSPFMPDAEAIITTFFDFNIPVDIETITVAPSSVSYHFNLLNLKHHKKAKTAIDAIEMAINKDYIMIDSKLAHFAINVSRSEREYVTLKTAMLLTNNEGINQFEANRTPTTAALGVGKEQVVIDLAKMPHLLIAGTTGSGKSVQVHSIIASMLFNASPASLGFIMIDPKQTELNIYNGLPHLLMPIVTDTKEAISTLNKMCQEMDVRYSQMKEGKVFKSKIVIVIDELADLMMTSGKEVEKYICRLAQMGRAAGIHLIVATQNPKADIITTLIRGNLPARIVFQVAESAGERVLETPGAKKLLGKGDGIFKDPTRPLHPIRFQSAFISNDDIKRIVDYWKSPEALRASILA